MSDTVGGALKNYAEKSGEQSRVIIGGKGEARGLGVDRLEADPPEPSSPAAVRMGR